MKLILVRHKTTPWNRQRRLQGHADIELDDGGREEARNMAKLLASFGIKNIVTSDLKRAKETGHIIGQHLGISPVTDERIRECSFGILEGKTPDEIRNDHGSEGAPGYPYDFSKFGGESYDRVLERHKEAVRDYAERFPDDAILFIGHGQGLNTLLHSLGQEPNLVRNEYKIIEI